MSKTNKCALVPKLRFGEFEGEWFTTPMGDIFSSSKLKGKKGLPTLSVTLDRGLILRDDNERETKTNLSAQEHRLVRKGEIAYNMMRMWQGAYGRAFCDGLVSPAYVILTQNDLLRSDFSEYFLKLTRTKYLLWAYSYGVTNDRLRLYYKDFAKIKAAIPTLPEQEKIATFLTSVDDRIEQLKQKKTLLQTFKKGVMQRLFAAGGKNDECGMMNAEYQHDETTQHSSLSIHHPLRFRNENGDPYPDWEEKKLGELGSFIGEGTPTTTNESYWNGSIPWVSSSDIVDTSIKQINIHRHITTEAVEESATKKIPANSILFVSRVGVGKLAISLKELCTSQDFCNFTPTRNNITYLGYYFFYNQKLLKRYAQGTSIKGLTSKELKDIIVKLPHTDEQTKIANYLSNLDTKINQVTQQIIQTQTFKKGLLQQMFV